jgi:hypothetical protein
MAQETDDSGNGGRQVVNFPAVVVEGAPLQGDSPTGTTVQVAKPDEQVYRDSTKPFADSSTIPIAIDVPQVAWEALARAVGESIGKSGQYDVLPSPEGPTLKDVFDDAKKIIKDPVGGTVQVVLLRTFKPLWDAADNYERQLQETLPALGSRFGVIALKIILDQTPKNGLVDIPEGSLRKTIRQDPGLQKAWDSHLIPPSPFTDNEESLARGLRSVEKIVNATLQAVSGYSKADPDIYRKTLAKLYNAALGTLPPHWEDKL